MLSQGQVLVVIDTTYSRFTGYNHFDHDGESMDILEYWKLSLAGRHTVDLGSEVVIKNDCKPMQQQKTQLKFSVTRI